MDWGAIAAEAKDNPFAQLLVIVGVMALIAAWIGRREDAALDLLSGVNAQLVKENDRLQKQNTALQEQIDKVRVEAEEARRIAADARNAEARAQEEAQVARQEKETAEEARRLAEAAAVEAALRADTAQKVAAEVEQWRGIPHRRTSDGGQS